jgi:hypothetical protein
MSKGGCPNPTPGGSTTVTALQNGDGVDPEPELLRLKTLKRTLVDVNGTLVHKEEVVKIFSDGTQTIVGEAEKVKAERIHAHFAALTPSTLVLNPGSAMFPGTESGSIMPAGAVPVRSIRAVKQKTDNLPAVPRMVLKLNSTIDIEDPKTIRALVNTESGRATVMTFVGQPNVTVHKEVLAILKTHKLIPKK